MTRKFISALARLRPGDASSYISKLGPQHAGRKVVLVCRVSRRHQSDRGNLKNQEANLRRAAESVGAIVVLVIRYVGSGVNPWWVERAAMFAQQHGAILLAESTDRFIRPLDYHSKRNPHAKPTRMDLDDLRFYAAGAPLVTLCEPNAELAEVRSLHSKRGQRSKGRKGGRPRSRTPGYLKQRRTALIDRVKRLRRRGRSLRAIARKTGVPFNTVHRWILSATN